MGSNSIHLSKSALIQNIRSFLTILEGKSQFVAVVKSNAYGHGMREIVSITEESGLVPLYAVNSWEEYLELRGLVSKEKPIIIMGELDHPEWRATQMNDPNLWVIVSSLDKAKLYSKSPTPPKIHLKIDTGMSRLGANIEDLPELLQAWKQENLRIDGLCSHFASTEDVTEHSYSRKQLQKFEEAEGILRKFGFNQFISHISASASTLLFPDARKDLVRVGISLYGFWPSLETKLSYPSHFPEIQLQPVLTWKSKIVLIRDVPQGTYIGYGCTYRAPYPTKLAVVPVGYYEGLDRRASNNGYLLVKGNRAKILGRVCMNMCMIDITHIPDVELEEEVVLIGNSGEETLKAEQLAEWSSTIQYEITTRIASHLDRIIHD
jgi:alanine racemase